MLVGRIKESSVLKDALNDSASHFISVYGRRRVGKTFLIRESFGYRFTFQHSGVYQASMKQQLAAFDASLRDAGLTMSKNSSDWFAAFENLKELLRKSTEKRKIVFIDELSWMDTARSSMLAALEHFWNGWASARRDIVLIVCSSATSWMISNVIHNKGGLYNRLTEQIHLQTFTLAECEAFARLNGLVMTRDQILQAYMIMGGVPYYWGLLKKGLSLPQNIDGLFFAENAPLKDELKYLYAAIFKNADVHLKIIKALASNKSGLTRDEIISKCNLINSGDLTKKLEELESCGFIRKYKAFGTKKKNAVYQLIDFFTIFYYTFMSACPSDEHFWINQINTPAVNTWMGFAFERVCLLHVPQIKEKLGISGVLTEVNAWRCHADVQKGICGTQIDLLIVRKDQIINLCEMKYSNNTYTMTKKTAESINNKICDLIAVTETKYAIHPVLVTNLGLVENAYTAVLQNVVTEDDLFVR